MSLRFPVMCFNDNVFISKPSEEVLTASPTSAVLGGWFKKMLIVDSDGQAHFVRDAKKLERVRPLWGRSSYGGFNWMWGIVRVELEFEGEPFQISVDEVRERMHSAEIGWHCLESRCDFDELEEAILNAKDVAELVQLVS